MRGRLFVRVIREQHGEIKANFCEIKAGELFWHNGWVFIKTTDSLRNSVAIANGEFCHFDEVIEVEKLESLGNALRFGDQWRESEPWLSWMLAVR